MNRTEQDQIAAEYGAEVKTNGAQDELCKVLTCKEELDYLFNLMGVTR